MGMVACFASASSEELTRLLNDPTGLEEYLHSETDDPPDYIDLDKSWHAIHYMLCGDAMEGSGPGAQAVLGGQEIGEDWGYGPARYLTPEEVAQVASFLDSLPPTAFSSRFAPDAMDAAEIYPQIWVRDGDEGLEYILEYYEQLRTFYRDVAAKGHGAFLWIS
jgi:hypothetical protein